jgi:hypothetical protein
VRCVLYGLFVLLILKVWILVTLSPLTYR